LIYDYYAEGLVKQFPKLSGIFICPVEFNHKGRMGLDQGRKAVQASFPSVKKPPAPLW